MDWTTTIQDAQELRRAFAGSPDARYRPITAWWWSGEPVERERLHWQFDQIVALGCGGLCPTGLALHGPVGGSAADEPRAFSDEWFALVVEVIERCRDHGLGFISWSPLMPGLPVDAPRLLRDDPALRGELVDLQQAAEPLPYGIDYGNPVALDRLAGPDTVAGRLLDRLPSDLADVVVGMFEDEVPAFPRWSPTFAEEFRALKGYDPPVDAFARDHGPRTPAIRWDVFDVATTRVEQAYTRWTDEMVRKRGWLAGFDQNNRGGQPVMSSLYALDPFRTMAWSNAPGADQMGDARFHLSLADLWGAPRTWLEGFHSHGWGMRLSDQARLLFEWGREGMNLFLPHGMYYSGRALWWEWAPPENGWKQPYARHYPAFAELCGRLMTALAAGRHVPEVAVLYPLSTTWADTTGHLSWGEDALTAERVYLDVFGMHGVPSGWDLERFARPSVLAEAGYDRVVVDERHVDGWAVPVVVPACKVLRTQTVQRLIAHAEAGHTVVVVEPVPQWSAEHGRDDAAFTQLVSRLLEVAAVAATPADVPALLPPPRVEGLKAQWRRVDDLDLVFVTGTGQVRLRGMADRAPERWDVRTGAIAPAGATVDGDDLLLDLDGPETLLALPPGAPTPAQPVTCREVALPTEWACSYLEWGENRWGDYRLPANPGTPPVERRTFAWREGDDPSWRGAPVTPEDVQQPLTELGFTDRMAGRTGRPAPRDRVLPDGWHEVVSTYGPKAVLDGATPLEYSERLGVEDVTLSTPIGLKGWVEPVKADLGPGGSGRITSWALLDRAADTHLVVEARGTVAVTLDGEQVLGEVDAGIVTIPLSLEAGWHRLDLDLRPRDVAENPHRHYRPRPRTTASWALMPPYRRDVGGIWGGPFVHPDHKGSPGPRRFRRRLLVPEAATVTVERLDASGEITFDVPQRLDAGEHLLEALVGQAPLACHFTCVLRLDMASGSVRIGTDERWESSPAHTDEWVECWEMDSSGAIGWGTAAEQEPRRSPLLDVAWLEGAESVAGHVERVWADSPEPPPPSWFCFTAPPGARAMTLPIVGDVQAWVDGDPVPVDAGRLPLREHARVALRVQAPAGYRGAACFTEHPLLELGDGTIRTGLSWHRQGLDVFSGVVLHRADVEMPAATAAVLDLGEVSGSVAVKVNGEDAGVLVCAPWRVPVTLRAGVNAVELEVANTLGPLASRGIPTPFGPEDQRFSGILGAPRILLEHP